MREETRAQLGKVLEGLEGREYRAYKEIAGRYDFGRFRLLFDHVQGDPFADASRVRALVPPEEARLPPDLVDDDVRRAAAADHLNRRLVRALHEASRVRGSGSSGELSVLAPGQAVLRRTSMLVHPDGTVEARFRAGLPARGRTILGREAAELICGDLPRAVEAALLHPEVDLGALRAHVEAVEDARALRAQLEERGLVAFVADGSILPRASGVDDRPLVADDAVPFVAPDALRVEMATPHSGILTGMGIPEGITLLVGGGFHGKSTLLRALERGVYDHLPGDGRERVVTVPSAVKVRAEDGRRIAGTDISNFIGNLPGGQDTRRFFSENASGSTSQAAAIAEALELGTRCLLLDEDTSATNFLIRDARVQTLVERAHEPITPFIDRARELHRDHGVSVVMVVGGSGDYFDVADTVIMMRGYAPLEVSAAAREAARLHPTGRRAEGAPWRPLRARVPDPESIDPKRGRRAVEVKASVRERMRFGEHEIELSAVEQLVEAAQARAVGRALARARGRHLDGARTLPEALTRAVAELEEGGLDLLDERLVGDYAEFRVFEMAAALARLRSLRLR